MKIIMNNERNLTSIQIARVKQSWAKVLPIADVASGLFYDRLFELHPELRPMFNLGNLVSQRKILVKAISMVVVSLERIETLIPTISDLGKRHQGYGVEDQHYDQVAAALLWMLETVLGDDWNEEVKTAWTNAYQLLASVMMEGARQRSSNAA